jgi:hypothetical protein
MKMSIIELILQCRKSKEVIQFSPQLSFFYGEMASGKSTIVRLVDFCLGGKLERTPAIREELISVRLSTIINGKEVLFEREAVGSTHIKIAWKTDEGIIEGLLAPVEAGPAPIMGENIFNVSDLILYFLGLPPFKVPLGENIVRLSFRDIMWYCYLKQDYLVSNFYNLGDYVNRDKIEKSRFVLRLIVGLFDERQNELDGKLHNIKELRKKRFQEIDNIRSFLKKFGYSSEEQITAEIEKTLLDIQTYSFKLKKIEEGYSGDTHFADDLRQELRDIEKNIDITEKAQYELNDKIEEQKTLKAELIASQAKLSRSNSAKKILEGAFFEFCPACGSKIGIDGKKPESCILCGQNITRHEEIDLSVNEVTQIDLKERIKELDESIDRHSIKYNEQRNQLNELRVIKRTKDNELDKALKNYDSKFLSQSRELEKQIAILGERGQNLKRMSAMPIEVNNLQEELDKLKLEQERIERQMQEETEKKKSAEKLIEKIEISYHESLLSINLPNMNKDDRVRINRTTWIPEIIPADQSKGKWSFFDIGSAGMKTLLNVCYALAIHKVAAANNLPVPPILIIDSPARNVDKDADEKVFNAFYTHLYELSQGLLSNTQFILLDNTYYPPLNGMDITKRYMTRADSSNPPLISYYRAQKPINSE